MMRLCIAKISSGESEMPVLTKDQVIEAAFELLPEEREEVLQRIAENGAGFHLTEEQKDLIRAEIEAHRRDPSTSISREELMANLRARL